MTWFKVDDSFYDHPKVFDAPDCAVALWVRAGTWSARNLTDGFVPAGMPARFCDDFERAVQELIGRGLWKRTKGGFQFHDWTDYQPTRDEAIAGRDGMSSGGALGNHRRWHLGQGKKNASCRYCQGKQDRVTDRVPDQVGDGVPESGPNPPTRPDPSPKNNIKTSSSPAAPATDSEDFERFWAAYPRRVGKGQARRAWATAIKRGNDPETIIEAAGRFTATRGNQDPKFTPHPSTWLNGERWGDAPEPEPAREPAPVMPWDLWS